MNPESHNYPSYNSLCGSVSAQTEFLERTTTMLQPIPQADRYKALLKQVSVNGAPFDSGKYITTLAMKSDNWDAHDEGDEAMRRLTAAVSAFNQVAPGGLRPGNVIYGFASMTGADTALVDPREKFKPQQLAEVIVNERAPSRSIGYQEAGRSDRITIRMQ